MSSQVSFSQSRSCQARAGWVDQTEPVQSSRVRVGRVRLCERGCRPGWLTARVETKQSRRNSSRHRGKLTAAQIHMSKERTKARPSKYPSKHRKIPQQSADTTSALVSSVKRWWHILEASSKRDCLALPKRTNLHQEIARTKSFETS